MSGKCVGRVVVELWEDGAPTETRVSADAWEADVALREWEAVAAMAMPKSAPSVSVQLRAEAERVRREVWPKHKQTDDRALAYWIQLDLRSATRALVEEDEAAQAQLLQVLKEWRP